MAFFQVLVLALLAVSSFGYDVSTRQYLPLLSQQYQNLVYPAQKTYPYYYPSGSSYPVDYFLRKDSYLPYYYQQKDSAVPREIYPSRSYNFQKDVVPSFFERWIYSLKYPYESGRYSYQIPFVGYNQQDVTPLRENFVYNYQTKDVPRTIANQEEIPLRQTAYYQTNEVPRPTGQEYFPVRQGIEGQVYPYSYYQTREVPQTVAQRQMYYQRIPQTNQYQINEESYKTQYPGYQIRQEEQEYPYNKENVFPFQRYQREQEYPAGEYVYPQTQDAFQRVFRPEQNIQGYSQDYPYSRYFSDVYAPRYPEEYFAKYQDSKKERSGKSHEKYDSKRSKEEKRESIRGEQYEKNFEKY